MKRIICALLLALAVIGLGGCEGEPQLDGSTFMVEVQVNSGDEISAIHFEYSLDGEPTGGAMMSNADGSALAKGDALAKDFIPQDFPENADLSGFGLELFVVDVEGNQFPCGESIPINAAYGNTYRISISGDYKEGFSARLIG